MNSTAPASRSSGLLSGTAYRRYGLLAVLAALIVFVPWRPGKEVLTTPLEAGGFSRLSTSAEISAYLARLAGAYPQARVETFGVSVLGRPLEALLLTGVPRADVSTSDRLTVLVVGSQHGTEPAGAETLQCIARELLAGTLRDVLDDVDVVLVPNANPDGRELTKRKNANQVNLNIDFVTLTQPESQALVAALQRYRPEVVLDVHESAVLKLKSLAKEGYMTNFSAQFEIANNPNIAPSLRAFAETTLLGPWIVAVNTAGLRAHRYIGEIRSSRQPVTNGGLTLNNLRNRTGIEGALSLLMETRLDPRDGHYPTFRNIRARVAMQQTSIEQLLMLVHAKRTQALAVVAAARQRTASAPLLLDPRYVPALGHPRVPIDLRRIADGQLETIDFADHRTVDVGDPLPMPAAYIIRGHQAQLAALLDLHEIEYRILDAPRTDIAVEFEPGPAAASADRALENVHERVVRVRAEPGDVWIDLAQPRGRLAAMLLDPRSTSSLWRTPAYVSRAAAGKPMRIYRVPR